MTRMASQFATILGLMMAASAASAWVLAPSVTQSSIYHHARRSAPLRLVKNEEQVSPCCATTTSGTRSDFLNAAFVASVAGISISTAALVTTPLPAMARGRATLEQQYERYAPRIRAGGTFYATDLKKLVATADFAGVAAALAEPPSRQKADLTQPDAGVAACARQAGQFSNARVLVAADLWAASFSESSISVKTKSMQEAVNKVRDVVEEMQKVARLGSGEEKAGGLFGLGAKKVDKNECAKKLRELYVQGGNAWNEYILASNDNLPLQFDRFDFIK